MKNAFIVARREFLTRIRSKWFIISTLIIPVFIVLVSVLPTLLMTKSGKGEIKVAIIDETNSIGKLIEETLTETSELEDDKSKFQTILLKGQNTDVLKEQANELLMAEEIKAYLVIPKDALDSNRVGYYSKSLSDILTQEQVEKSVNEAISRYRMINANIDPEIVSELTRDIDFKLFDVTEKGEEETEGFLAFFTPFIFLIILFITVFSSSQILLRSVMEERTNRLAEILLSSITSQELMRGKILGLGLLGLTQLLIYLFIGLAISLARAIPIVTISNLWLSVMYFIFGYLLFSAIYASVGAMFNSEQEAQQATFPLTILAIIPMIFSSYVISNPDSTLTTILSFIPPITPFIMMVRISVDMPPIWQIAITTVLLVLFIWFAMYTAGKIFRVALLIYGKKPNLPEILHWIKE